MRDVASTGVILGITFFVIGGIVLLPIAILILSAIS